MANVLCLLGLRHRWDRRKALTATGSGTSGDGQRAGKREPLGLGRDFNAGVGLRLFVGVPPAVKVKPVGQAA